MIKKHRPFKQFLLSLLKKKKLSFELLTEIAGRKAANRVLDNSDNELGAPALGTGHIPVLHGQLHETLGAIPDLKAQVAEKEEQLDIANQTQANRLRPTPRP
ncbi:Uncharacterised protein [Legionella beliardensis]|uniref:Uncharacterized protein n=1 Tax=Legionella beliardensis TaxID=91822 RepID=A0A378HZM4_9GAMM|nr:hypothetical protein [Legionella beliardensis]STX27835.1 Uncharacterised protein [Legionella beliardensis]